MKAKDKQVPQEDKTGPAKWTAIGVIGTAIFSAIGVVIAAYFGYLKFTDPRLPATQPALTPVATQPIGVPSPFVPPIRLTEYIGRILDSNTLSLIRGAKVTLDLQGTQPIIFQGTSPTQYTDTDGCFRYLISIASDKVNGRVRVDATGYESYDLSIPLSANTSTVEDIRLKPIIVSPTPLTLTPSPAAKPSPAPIPPPVPPSLIAPSWGGGPYRNPIIFKWSGSLSAGQAYRVSVHATQDSSLVAQSESLTSTCWETHLPTWAAGLELGWDVSVVSGRQEVSTSPTWTFWFNPIGGLTFVSPLCLP